MQFDGQWLFQYDETFMDLASLEEIMSTWLLFSYVIACIVVAFAAYVLMALSLYSIGKRRFFFGRGSWLAWIPFAQFWVLAGISDNYHWMVRSRKKKRRIVMLMLTIILLIAVWLMVLGSSRMEQALLDVGVTNQETFDEWMRDIRHDMADPYDVVTKMKIMDFISELKGYTYLIIFSQVVICVTAVTYAVFYYIALYDLYRSCDPFNAKIFLLLSILIGITVPIFMMICRKQDKGMRQYL